MKRTDDLLALSSLLLTEGGTTEEIAARLKGAPGVVDVVFDKISVWFRVDGAVPVFVFADPTDGGLLEGAFPPVEVGTTATLIGSPPFTGCPTPIDIRADNIKGTVGKTGEPKKALILGPWKWQMDWDVDTLTSNLKLPNSDYAKPGGGVTTIMTDDGDSLTPDTPSAFLFPDDPAVRIQDFCGWEEYETIILKTHGRTVCEEVRCHTTLSVGRFAETKEALRTWAGGATGVTFGTSKYGNLLEGLTPEGVKDCIRRLEAAAPDPSAEVECLTKLPNAGHLMITPDFFRANYPGGLKDRLIFLSACQGMKGGELARAIRGSGMSSGAILGFDRIIQTSVSNVVLEQFAEWVAAGTPIDEKAVRILNSKVDDLEGSADVAGQIEGDFTAEEMADVVPDGSEVTRGSDIVSLHTKLGGPELVDEGTVRVDGKPGDNEPDKLELVARLTGVGEEGPDPYEIEILLDDRSLSLEDYQWRLMPPSDDGVGDPVFEAEIVANVGGDLVPDVPVDLEIRVVLPDTDGAYSRWAYKDLDTGGKGIAIITIGGQTWEFEIKESVGFLGEACLISEDGTELAASGWVGEFDDVVDFSAFLYPLGVGTSERLREDNVAQIRVRDSANGHNWNADATDVGGFSAALAAIPGGSSQVDTLTIEGGHAWGTATFIDHSAVRDAFGRHEPLPAPVGGTFDIQCPG